MARKRIVIIIFWRSSLILKIVTRRLCPKELRPDFMKAVAEAMGVSLTKDNASFFGLGWLHLVAHRFFGLRNDLCAATLVGDLLGGRLGKVVSLDHEFFGQL